MFGLFGKKPDFMTLLQEAKGNKDAVVIDVREPDEYASAAAEAKWQWDSWNRKASKM